MEITAIVESISKNQNQNINQKTLTKSIYITSSNSLQASQSNNKATTLILSPWESYLPRKGVKNATRSVA